MSESMSPLHSLAYVYFGEDSKLFGPDPDSIIEFTSRGGERELIDEIRLIMARDPTEDDLRQLWSVTYRSGFEPEEKGFSYRGWFEHMLVVLRAE